VGKSYPQETVQETVSQQTERQERGNWQAVRAQKERERTEQNNAIPHLPGTGSLRNFTLERLERERAGEKGEAVTLRIG
jgi:hypothetical protein